MQSRDTGNIGHKKKNEDKQNLKKNKDKKLNKRAIVILPHIKPDVSSSTREKYAVLAFYKTRRVAHVFKSGKSSVGDRGKKKHFPVLSSFMTYHRVCN